MRITSDINTFAWALHGFVIVRLLVPSDLFLSVKKTFYFFAGNSFGLKSSFLTFVQRKSPCFGNFSHKICRVLCCMHPAVNGPTFALTYRLLLSEKYSTFFYFLVFRPVL